MFGRGVQVCCWCGFNPLFDCPRFGSQFQVHGWRATQIETSATSVIRRSGGSAERRKPMEIEWFGFLPKAATLFLQRSQIGCKATRYLERGCPSRGGWNSPEPS